MIDTIEATTLLSRFYENKEFSFQSVQLLLAQGANVHVRSINNRTGLMWAIEKNDRQAIDFMLNQGVDIHATDRFRTNALAYAYEKNNFPLFVSLLKKAISFETCAHRSEELRREQCLADMPLVIDILRNKKTDYLEVLLDYGFSATATVAHVFCNVFKNKSPLHVAFIAGAYENCELLIRYGADMNARCPEGKILLENHSMAFEKILYPDYQKHYDRLMKLNDIVGQHTRLNHQLSENYLENRTNRKKHKL